MKRLIWTGGQGMQVVKFMGIDATCGEAIVDFGEGDFEWLPISELKCFTSGKPLSEMLEVPHDLVATHEAREEMLLSTMRS